MAARDAGYLAFLTQGMVIAKGEIETQTAEMCDPQHDSQPTSRGLPARNGGKKPEHVLARSRKILLIADEISCPWPYQIQCPCI